LFMCVILSLRHGFAVPPPSSEGGKGVRGFIPESKWRRLRKANRPPGSVQLAGGGIFAKITEEFFGERTICERGGNSRDL